MAKRVKIGDVFEIKTEKGLVYGQYSHRNKSLGYLVRIFTGFYEERPDSYAEIVKGDIRLRTFFPLQTAVNQNIVEIVANFELPEEAKVFPLFRSYQAANPKTNKIDDWWLWDGENYWRIGKLSEEQKHYPLAEIINDTLLIEWILSEWRVENFI